MGWEPVLCVQPCLRLIAVSPPQQSPANLPPTVEGIIAREEKALRAEPSAQAAA